MNIKKHLVTGLVVLLPIALTFWIISFIIRFFTTPFLGIAEAILRAIGLEKITHSPEVMQFASEVLVLVFLFIILVVIGAFARHFFFTFLMGISDRILHRIPIVSSVYKTSQELIQTIMTTNNKSFKQVVLVPFPTDDSWSIGLVTRDDTVLDEFLSVYVPTTPNPTSGYLIMYKKSKVIPLDMNVEEALRYVISLGVLSASLKKAEPQALIAQVKDTPAQ